MPKVSVIMSVYNGERYLSEAIDSILNQTFKNFEFIIVNDGSTDRTSQILEDYKRVSPHLRIIHQENMGLIGSLNKAIKLAKGEYIARQDADDISLTQRLEKEVVFLNEHEDVGVVGTAASIIDENGTFLYAMPVLIENENIQERLLKKNWFVREYSLLQRRLKKSQRIGFSFSKMQLV